MTEHVVSTLARTSKNLIRSGILIALATLATQASKSSSVKTIKEITTDIRRLRTSIKDGLNDAA